jgi:hypothetical protein
MKKFNKKQRSFIEKKWDTDWHKEDTKNTRPWQR